MMKRIKFTGWLLRRIPIVTSCNLMKIFATITAKVAGTGFSFLLSIMLARFLGATDLGVYFLALTVITIGATVSRLGLDSAVLRFASVAYAQDDLPTLAALYKLCMGLIVVAGLTVSFLIWLGLPSIFFNSVPANQFHEIISILLVALIPMAFLLVQGEFLKAVGAPSVATLVQSAFLPALCMVGLGVLLFYKRATLSDYVHLYTVAVLLVVAISVVLWSKRVPGLWQVHGRFSLRLLLCTSLPLLWVTSMNMVMSWTDVLILGFWADSTTVGIYGVAIRVAALTAFIMIAVNSVTVPQFATLYAKGEKASLERLVQKSTFWVLVSALPVVVILFLFPQLVLGLYGEEFASGGVVLRVLVFGQLLSIMMGAVGSLLMVTGHEKILLNVLTASAILNIVGNVLLIPELGAVGAAISTAVSLLFMTVLSYSQVLMKLKINSVGYLPIRNLFSGW